MIEFEIKFNYFEIKLEAEDKVPFRADNLSFVVLYNVKVGALFILKKLMKDKKDYFKINTSITAFRI